MISASASRSAGSGILLMLSGAALLPLVRIGSLTIDNYLALVGLLWLVVVIAKTNCRVPPAGPFGLLAFGFLVLGIAALLSDVANGTFLFLGTARFVSYATICVVLSQIRRVDVAWLRGAVVAVGAVIAVSISLQRFGLLPGFLSVQVYDLESASFRYGGVIGHPNFAAYFIGLCIIGLLTADQTMRWRMYAVMAPIFIAALILTGARNAFLALLVGLLVIALRMTRRVLLLILPGMIILLSFGQTLIARFAYLQETGGFGGSNAAGWRVAHWRLALEQGLSDWPWGVGWNSYVNYSRDGLAVHNGYLQVFVELGFAGVVGCALVFAGLLVACWRSSRPASMAFFWYCVVITVSDPGVFYPPVTVAAIVLVWSAVDSRSVPGGVGMDEGKLVDANNPTVCLESSRKA